MSGCVLRSNGPRKTLVTNVTTATLSTRVVVVVVVDLVVVVVALKRHVICYPVPSLAKL